ncbi:MAG TPA: DUF4375 domain-containing protein [Candidatus Solibacter sp.]|nr:DUF4375 domain-containing protein [Candidatus Solibacter sp.]
MAGYWQIVEPIWTVIEIGEGYEVFRQTFNSVPRGSALLFAAHFCQSEVCNGGFYQLFWNSTGVLAPEAEEGFREIGQRRIAMVVQSAIRLFGAEYPRQRQSRQEYLAKIPKSDLNALDENFYALISSENGGFEEAADRYANQLGSSG